MLRFEFEEYRPARPIWGWILVITASILTLGWGMVSHMAVPEVARQWDFGARPDAPGQTAFTTVPPPRARRAPLQIEMPPEYVKDVNVP